jgi:hypothetical protein
MGPDRRYSLTSIKSATRAKIIWIYIAGLMHLTAKPPETLERVGGFALTPRRVAIVGVVEPECSRWSALLVRPRNHYTRASSHLDPGQSSLFAILRCK